MVRIFSSPFTVTFVNCPGRRGVPGVGGLGGGVPRGLGLGPPGDRRGRRRRTAVPGLPAPRRAVRVRGLRQPVVLLARLPGTH